MRLGYVFKVLFPTRNSILVIVEVPNVLVTEDMIGLLSISGALVHA